MEWRIELHDEFDDEISAYSDAVKIELAAHMKLLARFGPQLGRPHADTLNGSKHSNMKELRFKADDGVWRIAFAFDPARNAILLVGGDKSGTSEKRFYKTLVSTADARFDEHLERLKGENT